MTISEKRGTQLLGFLTFWRVVAFGSFDPELAGALQQDAVYVGFGTGKQSVGQRPAVSLVSRPSKRVMAASWRAWLSSVVATIA